MSQPTVLSVSSLLAAASCCIWACSSGPKSAFPAPLVQFAHTAPTFDGSVKPEASECHTRADCERACSAGNAHACAESGDWLYVQSPAQATRQWSDACMSGNGLACQRLVALTGTESQLADALELHACSNGQSQACLSQGALVMLRALSKPVGEQQRLDGLQRAVYLYRHACALGAWRGCLLAALLLERDEFKRLPQAKVMYARAFHHAADACKGDSPNVDACGYRAQYLERQGDVNTAKALYARACHIHLQSLFDISYDDGIEKSVCRRAKELGVLPPRAAYGSEAPGARLVTAPASAIDAKRIFGNKIIHPPNELKMRLGNARLIADVKICLTRSGLVDRLILVKSSGFFSYDALLLDRMRGWRYRPFEVDGQPRPVCSAVTFVYMQKR